MLLAPYFGGAGMNPSRLRPGSGLGLGFGAFLTSFLPLSLLPMGRSVTQRGGGRKEPLEENDDVNYSLQVIEVRQTGVFSDWFRRLRDEKARSRILIRIRRLSLGNFGDVKPVGNGVSELRIDYGPGYRVYLQQRGSVLILLLAGGSKKTQQADIAKAKKLAKEWANGS